MSLSRIHIAQIVDDIFMRVLLLFDLSSLSFFEKWIIGYARLKIFQKMQTLFQMGKKKQLLELLDYVEKVIPELKKLANDPYVFITITGKLLNEKELEEIWNKPIPDEVKNFINNKNIWYDVMKSLEKDYEKRKGEMGK